MTKSENVYVCPQCWWTGQTPTEKIQKIEMDTEITCPHCGKILDSANKLSS
jgi:DNA-directed RNA polymerase subunit RPC12/RpoP